MAYLGEYTEVGWQNEPSRATPINAHNLGIMEDGIKRLFYYLLAGGGTGGGSAADGREVELRNNGEYIQWKYSGDEEWVNLVPLSDLKGKDGDDYVLTEEDILKIAEKVKIDVPDSAADISFENEGTDLKSTNVQGAIGELSGQNVDRANTLWAIMKKTAFVEVLTDAELNAFKIAWGITDSGEEPETPEVTLSSISATYSGGSVLVGTSVNNLTGIVLTANYSDGTSKTVTGYSLSGTIKEGSNTVTVSYGGKSTTITVIGYVENEPEITLSSISATYTGGNVPVGTTLTDLTGITVTGTYSDGSTSPITGYTLSGTIAEGSNTITVSYSGKTTTFTVTGVAESTEPELLWHWDFTTGSWVDTVSNLEAIMSEDATIDSKGVHTTSETSYVAFPFDESMNGRTLEIKFGTFELIDTGKAMRLITGRQWTGTSSVGLFWSTKDCWTSATATITEFTNMNMFSGKTVVCKWVTNNRVDLYLEEQFLCSIEPGTIVNYIYIGSVTSSSYPVIVESAKVY